MSDDVEALTKACPYCAERILSAAIKCKHCGEMLSDSPWDETEAFHRSLRPQRAPMPKRRPFKHGIHVFLTIITLGAWIPIWVLLYLFRDKMSYY